MGIVQISQAAAAALLNAVNSYSDGSWAVLDKTDMLLASGGDKENILALQKTEISWSGIRALGNARVIGYADQCGFGGTNSYRSWIWKYFFHFETHSLDFLVGLIVVIAIAFLVSYVTSYRFTKPVTRMIQSIQAFGKPKLDVRMEDSSIQEFHDMGIVFNQMAERIEYLITQVYEKEILAVRAQVKYLQSQINPHFQFNILAMLSLKAKMAGNEEVYDGLNAFSKLMQGKIFREKEIKIKVKEELEIVQFYLYLQKSRYQDKLSYEVTLENPEIENNLIPRLLIEPLVENAVSHGLEPKREKGMLKVHLYERELLHICVEDNGVGIDFTKMEEKQEKSGETNKIEHTHTGWENTRRMLQILYGDDHEFKVWSEKEREPELRYWFLLKEERAMWKVLAADDESYIREALQKLINWEKMDCSLEKVVSDGQELLDGITGSMPDIVITDIQMPGVDGLQVCKYIYETSPETQVIILTAYSDFEYAKEAIKYSACGYVLKISIIDELPEAVEKQSGTYPG